MTLKTIGQVAIALCIWYLLVLTIVPRIPGAKGQAAINMVKNQAMAIEEKQFSRDELAVALSDMRLDFGLNRWIPTTTYPNATNWHVTLVPEKKKAFADAASWAYRFIFLEFHRMEYPNIETTGYIKEHNNASQSTR